MLTVIYKGIQGVVVGESSIEGMPFITWYVKLSNGQLVEAGMHECILVCESIDLKGIAV